MGNWMKAGLLCITFLTMPVFSGVTIQEQGHWVVGQVPSSSYSFEESFPVSGVVSDAYATASSSAGNFSVDAFASGDRTKGYIYAFAYSGYLITLDQPILTIDLDGTLERFESSSYIEVLYSLTDVETQQEIDNQLWNSISLGTGTIVLQENRNYTLSTGHTYALSLMVNAGEGGGGKSSLQVNLETETIPVVPAPDPLLLAGVGIGLLGWFSRWKSV